MQQGVALLKELRDNMIGFADQRIEKISVDLNYSTRLIPDGIAS